MYKHNFSSIQHNNLEVVCNPKVIYFLVYLYIKIGFKDLKLVFSRSFERNQQQTYRESLYGVFMIEIHLYRINLTLRILPFGSRCKHGKVYNSWSLFSVKWKWIKNGTLTLTFMMRKIVDIKKNHIFCKAKQFMMIKCLSWKSTYFMRQCKWCTSWWNWTSDYLKFVYITI